MLFTKLRYASGRGKGALLPPIAAAIREGPAGKIERDQTKLRAPGLGLDSDDVLVLAGTGFQLKLPLP